MVKVTKLEVIRGGSRDSRQMRGGRSCCQEKVVDIVKEGWPMRKEFSQMWEKVGKWGKRLANEERV